MKDKLLEQLQADRDAAMIALPINWPMWPFLPLKRRDNDLEARNLGVLFDDGKKSKGKIVYHCYVFGMKPDTLKTCPKTEYESVSALLADGWVVD